jgi:hypothetical protein
MATDQDVYAAWSELIKLFQPNSRVKRGLLGDGEGSVDVDGKPGWSWIRYVGETQKLSQVRNPQWSWLADDTPVIVGKLDAEDPYEQVKYPDLGMYADQWTDAQLAAYAGAPHGENHHGSWGNDPAPIDLNNIEPGKVKEQEPPDQTVYVEPFIYPYGLDLIKFDGNTVDLSAEFPAAGNHRYALVHLVYSTGELGYAVADAVPAAADPDMPSAVSNTIPLGIARLVGGETEITQEDHIWQWKLLWNGIGAGSVSPHTHTDDSSGGASLLCIEELMFDNAEPISMVGTTIFPTHAYHKIFVSGLYVSGTQDLIRIEPDTSVGCAQVLIIRPAEFGLYATYSIRVRHAVGNIWLSGKADIILDEQTDHLLLIYNGSYWCEMITGGGGGGAPTDAQYVTIAADATLTDERILTGTANQVVVTDGGAGGNVVLSTPQDIHTAATPQFAGLTIDGNSATALLVEQNGVNDDTLIADN